MTPRPSILTFLSALFTTLLLAAIPACTSTQQANLSTEAAVLVTPANTQIAAQALTTDALTFVTDPKQRAIDAADSEAVAHAVRSLATGTAPTVDQFQGTIKQFGGPTVSPGYALLANNLGALYASLYPSLTAGKNSAQVVSYLSALAAGVESGAGPFLAN